MQDKLLAASSQGGQSKSHLTEADKKILSAAKTKKREVRRQKSKELNTDDQFDKMLESYKVKVLGKIQENMKSGASGAAFEEAGGDSD